MDERIAWPLVAKPASSSSIRDDIRRQLVAARPAVIAGFGFAFLLLSMVVMIRFWRGTSFAAFMQDPATYAGAPAYVGAISHIGIIIWAAAAAICLFAAWTLRRGGGDGQDVRFLAWSGLGTLYLAVDDAMLLHEEIIFQLTGLSEGVIFGAYIAAFAFYIAWFHRSILRAEYALFLIALSFLGLSVIQDLLLPFSDVQLFFEDASKLIAIIFWLIFFARTGAAAASRQAVTAPERQGPRRESNRAS